MCSCGAACCVLRALVWRKLCWECGGLVLWWCCVLRAACFGLEELMLGVWSSDVLGCANISKSIHVVEYF